MGRCAYTHYTQHYTTQLYQYGLLNSRASCARSRLVFDFPTFAIDGEWDQGLGRKENILRSAHFGSRNQGHRIPERRSCLRKHTAVRLTRRRDNLYTEPKRGTKSCAGQKSRSACGKNEAFPISSSYPPRDLSSRKCIGSYSYL